MKSFLIVLKDILNNLLHEDTVISLSSHSGVSSTNSKSDFVDKKIGSSSASFSGDSANLLGVPRDESLDAAQGLDDLVFSILWISEQCLTLDVPEVQNDGSGD